MTTTGFYAGSFDPPTLGHLDLIRRCLRVVDKLVVGVGIHAEKSPWLQASVTRETRLKRLTMPRAVNAPKIVPTTPAARNRIITLRPTKVKRKVGMSSAVGRCSI